MKYVVVSFLLFLLSFTGIQKPLYGAFGYLFTPLQFGLKKTASGLVDFRKFYMNVSSVRRENVKLLENTIILESTVLDLKRFEEENTVLKEQLDVESEDINDRRKVLVNVMGNPRDTSGGTLILDKGTASGISVGDIVILGNFLVGKVTDTQLVKSTVQLITSPDSSITIYNIDSYEKTEALAVGKHGSSLSAEKILPSENLDIGDMFVTSGKDGVYYPGLYVGKVTEISSDDAQPLRSANLATIFDIKKIDRLFVLIQK